MTRTPREVTSNRVIQNVKKYPYILSHSCGCQLQVSQVMKFLCTLSSILRVTQTFILEETVKVLHTKIEPVQLKLSTMTQEYSETAKSWSHLEHIADEIAPLQSCDIGLLIGYNCPQALVPRQVVAEKKIKEVILPTDVIKVLESDFVERASEDEHLSQEDLQFMSIMKSGIKTQEDGHYEMPLPFKKKDQTYQTTRYVASTVSDVWRKG
ncbi:hypothetical protein F2P79_025716 [Pimephales promelas]|nr:hypothetical protein F2P79_025716 [Pimephales promelas]